MCTLLNKSFRSSNSLALTLISHVYLRNGVPFLSHLSTLLSIYPIHSPTPPNSPSPPHNNTPPANSLPSPPTHNTCLSYGICKPITKLNLTTVLNHETEPKTITQALKNPFWCKAMDEELSALIKNKTSNLVPPLPITERCHM